MRILIVEDDAAMVRTLAQGLEEEHHTVTAAADGEVGLAMASTYEFDVIVLDVMLPLVGGVDVARRLRAGGVRTPILMLTARDSTVDVVSGLDAGADDYLTKPFAFEELLARLRSLGRRRSDAAETRLTVADLILDPGTRKITRNGRPIHLTATEFRLLESLMRASGRVLTRATLIEAVWGIDGNVEANTLDAFIRLLRKKLDDPFQTRLVHTVHGIGYRLSPEGE